MEQRGGDWEKSLSLANKWKSVTLKVGTWERESDCKALRNEVSKAEDVDDVVG